MKKFLSLILLFVCHQSVFGQIIGPRNPSNTLSISQNSISNLAVFGDTVWISPYLQQNIGHVNDWIFPTGLDSISIGNGRAYSIFLAKDTILAGIGNVSNLDGQSIDRAFGFYSSTDGGQNWNFIPFKTESNSETTFNYGANTITQLPVIVREQSPPYSVAQRGNVFFSASWASGITRTLDNGITQERLLLPPTREDSLDPRKTYTFEFNPRLDNNFLGFSVLIDSKNRVWFGTAGGINWSPNAISARKDSVKWYHKAFNSNSLQSLPGNWIIHIVEQVRTNRIWMTNWIAQNGEDYAISYTDDLGKTFKRFLVGEKIYDIAFFGNSIVAVGDNGIFVSPDDGSSWNQIKGIRSANALISSSASYYTVDSGTDGVWIGSSEGLVFTQDFEHFEITRVDFPLSGGNQFEPSTSAVKTYAYPNPFSPNRHTYARIVFETKSTNANAKVSLYDFSMTKIRELNATLTSAGTYEALWDGFDGKGRIVANGVAFYVVEVDGKKVNGKILVID